MSFQETHIAHPILNRILNNPKKTSIILQFSRFLQVLVWFLDHCLVFGIAQGIANSTMADVASCSAEELQQLAATLSDKERQTLREALRLLEAMGHRDRDLGPCYCQRGKIFNIGKPYRKMVV